MDPVRVIEIKESVFADNNKEADRIRKMLKDNGTFLLNLMSGPGSGKTTTLSKILPLLQKKMKVAVMEADIDSSVDAQTLSVPEGHDKPLKYPLIFEVCQAMIINKIDVLPYFDFDMDKVIEYAHSRNPELKVFPISAKTGEGVEALAEWLIEEAKK